jgi:hypothetical protein
MFLELKFHDNDFGYRFLDTLSSIWNKINGSKSYDDHRSNTEVFKFLHDKGVLQPMIVHLSAIKSFENYLLWSAEGMNISEKYFKEPEWLHEVPKHYSIEFFLNYFKDMEIIFHEKAEFTLKDQNGEHCWLNMEYGEVGIF